MDTITSKLVAAGVLAALTLITGLIVSKSGRPLNTWLANFHKLIAVGTVVLIYMAVSQLYKTTDEKVFIAIVLAVISAVLFLALIATGAFLLQENMVLPAYVLKIHQIAPLLALAFSATSILLLIRSRM